MTPMTAVSVVPEVNSKGLSAVEQANAFSIQTQDDAAVVDLFCVSLKALEHEVDAAYDEHIETAFKAHKSLCAKKKIYALPILEARAIAKIKLGAWQDKLKALAAVEEARLRSEAKKRAEDEALALAARAAEFGDDKTADAIISAPVVVEPVRMAAPVKTATVFQTRWKAKVVNPAMVPDEYWVIDEQKIGAVVRATKGAINIPGVSVFSERV